MLTSIAPRPLLHRAKANRYLTANLAEAELPESCTSSSHLSSCPRTFGEPAAHLFSDDRGFELHSLAFAQAPAPGS